MSKETAPLIKKLEVSKPKLNKVVVVVGSTGTGKSTIINMLYNDSVLKENLNRPCEVGATSNSVTKKTSWLFDARDLTLYVDTVGLSDPHQSDRQIGTDLKKFIKSLIGGVNCIIVVLKYGRINREERINLEIIKKLFDKSWINNCIVVATFYDGEVNSVTQIIDENAHQKAVIGWTHNDAETSAFIEEMKGNVVFTDNSLGRYEEANSELKSKCQNQLMLSGISFDKETVPKLDYPLAVCRKCGKKLKMQQTSTSSARYHLKSKHPQDFAKLTKLMAEREEKRAEDLKEIHEATVGLDEAQDKLAHYTLSQNEKTKAMGSQKTLAEYGLGKYSSQHKKKLEADMEIMKFIARTGLAFEVASNPALRDFVKYFNLRMSIKDPTTFKKYKLPLLYSAVMGVIKSELKMDLQDCEGVALTTACWNSKDVFPFISLTLHYISKEFSLKKFILNFDNFTGHHTSCMIAKDVIPSNNDFELMQGLLPALKLLKLLSNNFSTDSEPVIHIVMITIYKMTKYFESFNAEPETHFVAAVVRRFCKELVEQINQQSWESTPLPTSWGNLFHPHYRGLLLKEYKLYEEVVSKLVDEYPSTQAFYEQRQESTNSSDFDIVVNDNEFMEEVEALWRNQKPHNIRNLRQQCLDTVKSFIASCTDRVPPAQIQWFDIVLRLLEKWFSSYRNMAANDRMKKIMKYLAKDCQKEQLKTNKCLLCSEDVLHYDIAQTICNHIFHYNCISLAIRKPGGPCPVCCNPVFKVYSTFG